MAGDLAKKIVRRRAEELNCGVADASQLSPETSEASTEVVTAGFEADAEVTSRWRGAIR